MKLGLIIALGLVAIAVSQPVAEDAGLSVSPVDDAAMEADTDAAIDMMPDESALKIIMHKLEHWLKKCYKKGGCRDDYHHGYGHHGYSHQSYEGYSYGGYGHGK
ncbi:hypothetical protein OUZ56_028680 [Daphnia magna]|uniref:Uncharacterized protein n=1 Tax=Daphnia magna TaxID=35525 RepID=A0ABR0B4M0_9CRUS|nr:hypothetical protein OUZ56_028680 [Daphnia magna]